MKKALIISSLLICAAMQLSGCSHARYPIADISTNPSLAHLDDNSMPFYTFRLEYNDIKCEGTIELGAASKELEDCINKIKASSDKKITYDDLKGEKLYYSGIRDIELSDNKTFSVPYHNTYSLPNAKVIIPIEFPSGRIYAAHLDTGCKELINMPSNLVLENKFPIMPLYPDDPNSKSNSGFCHIPWFNIGSAKIIDTVAFYEQKQWQTRFLNIPVHKETHILIGRKFIKSFDYIIFDNVHKEAVFSKEGAFKPDDIQSWSSYPFYEDPNNGDTIMVDLPIAGKVLSIAFDSCWGAPGLNLNKEYWRAIEQYMTVKRSVKSESVIFDGTIFPVQRLTVSKLQIANKTLKNVELNISDDIDGLCGFGLAYFSDTVVVLDYVNNLFWIKS